MASSILVVYVYPSTCEQAEVDGFMAIVADMVFESCCPVYGMAHGCVISAMG